MAVCVLCGEEGGEGCVWHGGGEVVGGDGVCVKLWIAGRTEGGGDEGAGAGGRLGRHRGQEGHLHTHTRTHTHMQGLLPLRHVWKQ